MSEEQFRKVLSKLQKQRQSGVRSASLLADIAKCHMGLGQMAEAEKAWREAAAVEPNNAQIQMLWADVLISLRRFGEALEILQRLSKTNNHAMIFSMMAVCFEYLGRPLEADKANQIAVLQAPNDVATNMQYSKFLWTRPGRRQHAMHYLERAKAAAKEDYVPLMLHEAKLLKQTDRYDEAKAILHRVMKVPQHREFAMLELARILSDEGKFAEAREYVEKLLTYPTTHVEALCLLPNLKKDAPDVSPAAYEEALANPAVVNVDRLRLEKAFSAFCDGRGEYGEAIRHSTIANGIEKLDFDIERFTAFIGSLIGHFTADWAKKLPRPAPAPNMPQFVFVIGMPRSGTTLTTETLAKVKGTRSVGEQSYFINLLREMGSSEAGLPHQRLIDSLTPERTAEVVRNYVDLCRSFGDADTYVDKMPHNFVHLPLIRHCLPDAKFVWCQRNPVDNCVSIYLNPMNNSHAYSRSLTWLGKYYLQYQRLMAHWQQIPELQSFPVDYDTFVSDGGALRQQLLDHVAGADAEVGEESSSTFVRTFSKWQVRQPVYTSSVGRWKRYEPYIGELLEALNWPKEA